MLVSKLRTFQKRQFNQFSMVNLTPQDHLLQRTSLPGVPQIETIQRCKRCVLYTAAILLGWLCFWVVSRQKEKCWCFPSMFGHLYKFPPAVPAVEHVPHWYCIRHSSSDTWWAERHCGTVISMLMSYRSNSFSQHLATGRIVKYSLHFFWADLLFYH